MPDAVSKKVLVGPKKVAMLKISHFATSKACMNNELFRGTTKSEKKL
jgi:hypothetical protein